MKVYIGFDPRDWLAYQAACASIHHYASGRVRIVPLVERDLRAKGIYRRSYDVDPKGQMRDSLDRKPFSTQFSFTRFAVPILEDYADEWVVFLDADVMLRADIAELFGLACPSYGAMCVKHEYNPEDSFKMDGVIQTRYFRKNWSSVMLINPAKCRGMNIETLNTWPGSALHALSWVDPIGELPREWNWLDGENFPEKPKLIHYTRGTPDMIEGCAYEPEWWGCLEAARVSYPLSGGRCAQT